jgi:hypothetical protein
MAIALDRRQRRRIVAKFIALPVESHRLCVKVFPAFVVMPLRHLCRRFGKALRRVGIAQPRQGHITALGGGLRGIERQPVQRLGLDFFDRGQNFVGLAELAILDRLLRLRLQRGDFRIVAGLRRRRRFQLLEFSGDLDELRREPFRGNIGLAQNFQRAFDLALIEIELFLQSRDRFLLRLGEIFQRLRP